MAFYVNCSIFSSRATRSTLSEAPQELTMRCSRCVCEGTGNRVVHRQGRGGLRGACTACNVVRVFGELEQRECWAEPDVRQTQSVHVFYRFEI